MLVASHSPNASFSLQLHSALHLGECSTRQGAWNCQAPCSKSATHSPPCCPPETRHALPSGALQMLTVSWHTQKLSNSGSDTHSTSHTHTHSLGCVSSFSALWSSERGTMRCCSFVADGEETLKKKKTSRCQKTLFNAWMFYWLYFLKNAGNKCNAFLFRLPWGEHLCTCLIRGHWNGILNVTGQNTQGFFSDYVSACTDLSRKRFGQLIVTGHQIRPHSMTFFLKFD